MGRVITVCFAAVAVLLAMTPHISDGEEVGDCPSPGLQDVNLRHQLESLDEATIVLLDGLPIYNNPAWRDSFPLGQVGGFGVRTEAEPISNEDLERLKELLLWVAPFDGLTKGCIQSYDTAIRGKGPTGEVEVAIELWCGRMSVRSETAWSSVESCNIDAIVDELSALVARYFPEDSIEGRERR